MKPGMRNLLIAVTAVALFAASFGITWAITQSGDDTAAIKRLESARGLCAAVAADASGRDPDALYSKSSDGRTLSTEATGGLSLELAQVLLSCVVGRLDETDGLKERIKAEPSGSVKFGDYSTSWALADGGFTGSVAVR